MRIYDTHTHLYAKEFDADREQLIRKAHDNGVVRFYLPNIDSTSIEPMLGLEEKFPELCFPMMGLHPCSVNADWEGELAIVRRWLDKRRFIAIGEIGIDLYWDKTFYKEQLEAFKKQIDWALEFDYPVVIHTRSSMSETIGALEPMAKRPEGIFHCFSGTAEEAEKVIALGFKLGVGGVVTFKNSGLDAVVKATGLEHLVLETDAPYLAPVPHRGKRNEPSYILDVARRVAEILQVSVDEVAEKTRTNAEYIFRGV